MLVNKIGIQHGGYNGSVFRNTDNLKFDKTIINIDDDSYNNREFAKVV